MTQVLPYDVENDDLDEFGEEVFVFPTSFAQQRLWFLDQFEPGSPYYNIPQTVRLSGRLDIPALEHCLNEIVRRHEALRTTFATLDGQPVQVVAPALTLPLPVIDLSALPKANRRAEAMRLATEEARRPFDLSRGPLLRATLLRLDEQEHIALLTMHHIVSDGWSMGVLIGEIAALYNAFSLGKSSPLPELPIQYADYAEWQQDWLQGEVLEAQIDYWKQQLGGDLPVLELPTDHPRPAVQTNVGATQSIKLSKSLAKALKALSQQEGGTLFMTLMAAFQVLLYRYSGQEDICVGSPIANRNRAEVEGLIGLFINTLVLRADLSGEPTFRELLARVREMILGAYAHQDVPFETIVEELQPERDMSHTPLFQVMFILQNAPMKAQRLPGLNLEVIDVHSGTSTFDLTLAMAEEENGLDASIEYNTDLFEHSTIARMLGHFKRLLDGIAAKPDQTISELPLLSQPEMRQLLFAWNDTGLDIPQDTCIHQLFEAQVERTPDSLAVVVPSKSWGTCEQLTYAELNRRANQVAHYLRKLGVGPETVVGVSVDRSLDTIVSVLGVLKSGGAYLPLDPMYPQERLAFMIEDAQISVLLTQEPLLEKVSGIGDQVPGTHSLVPNYLCLDRDWEMIAQESDQNPPNLTLPENLVYMIYTSGSTGQSKGVMLQHSSLVNAYKAWEQAYELHSVRSHLQMANFSFDVFSGDLVRALCSGGKLVLCPREWLLAPEKLYELMLREKTDIAEFVPAVLRHLAQYLDENGGRLDNMRVLACGSDSWYVGEYRKFKQFCGPQTRLVNSFGLTEATIDSTYFESSQLDLPGDQLVPIGRPFANTRLYILDVHNQPVPVGVPGELHIAGPSLARGYHQRPQLTAEKFFEFEYRDSDFEICERVYKTGDLARYLPNGNVEFLGRMDHQLKIRGFRIEPGEIEAVLGNHPNVREAAIIAAEAALGDRRLAAYVVAERQPAPTPGELRRFVQERLPDYMVPSTFILLDALPLTPNGKVDRQALPAPDWSRRELADQFVAARTPAEEMLASIWTQVLGVDQVGVYDNFFELGGHSLLATQVVSRIRETFEIELPLRNIFESPTVATLAEQIEVLRRAEEGLRAPVIRPIPRDPSSGLPLEAPPLSFAQQRLWFLDQLEPGSPSYNLPEAVRLTGLLDISVLEECLNEVLRRHESLRTTFKMIAGKPVQVILPELAIQVKLTDLSSLNKTEREAEALRLAQVEAQRPFDLASGPLLRAHLLRMDPEDHMILLTMHHIVGDNWSTNVLIQEVAILYDAFSRGLASPLPPLPIQYADFARWQRDWLQGDVLESQISYWKRQLTGVPPLLEIPTDRPRPAVQTFRGSYHTFALSGDLSRNIKALCRQEGVTLFMVLLAAFQTLLYRYSGQEDITIGTPIANRNRGEVEGLIGFFVNTLVLRSDFSREPSVRNLLKAIREMTLEAYAHQDVPFEMIVDALQPERNLSHSPLFQVMFALQNAAVSSQSVPGSGLRLSPVEAHSGTAKFDLTLFMAEDGDHLSGALEYNTELFDERTIRRMLGHFENLLAGMVTDPDRLVWELPLLSEVERRQLLVEWNDTAAPFPQKLCAHQLFEAQAARTPDAVALTYLDQNLTYAELNQRANQLAHYLRKLGVGPEGDSSSQSLVGVCLQRSPEMVVGLLGVLKAGGAYVPMDPSYPPERLAFMMEDARVPVLLTQEGLLDKLSGIEDWGSGSGYQGSGDQELDVQTPITQSPIPIYLCLDRGWETIAQEPTENLKSGVTPENLAYVIYTSGSTGKPKGAMILHRGLVNYLTWCQQAYPLKAGQGSPVHSSVSFDLTVTSLFSPLVSGGRALLLPEELGVEALEQAIREEKNFSLIKITPAHLQMLGEQLKSEQATDRTHAFIIGGENLKVEHIDFWQTHASETALVNEYGPTETVVGCCVYWTPLGVHKSGVIPIGRPIINTRLYVLDSHRQPVPVGVPGELYIGGAGVARGYLNRPELTAEKFLPDPFVTVEDRMQNAEHHSSFSIPHSSFLYRTGDLVRYLPDGNLECLGRIDFQVKIRGFRVELGEIESVLSQHPQVDDVVVWVWDEAGTKRLVAYVVPIDEPGSISKQVEGRRSALICELRNFIQERLPDYMVPSAFVFLESLPLTPNGKVDRRGLPKPDLSRLDLETSYIPPRTPQEEILAGIFAEVLGVDLVGATDNFFEMGGHSLLATQVTSRVRDAFRVELPLRSLFEAPTVAGLAVQVDAARRTVQGISAPPLEPVSREGDLALSFAQQRLWFLDQLEPGSPLYNIPTPVRLTGVLDVSALEKSINAVLARHESLRTVFAEKGGRPVQVILPELKLVVPLVDLRSLPVEGREGEAMRLAAEDAARPFDLAHGPLVRASLLRLDEKVFIALLNTHHIISDDWSLGVFIREIAVFYEAFTTGTPARLPDLEIQYPDYAQWQRNCLQGEALESQLEYWRDQLAGLPPLLELPADHPRPAVQTFRGAQQTFELTSEVSQALKALSREQGATLFMILLAAFQTLLYRYTGQEDISVGTPIANRTHSEVEALIGFFINTLVMRGDLSGEPSFRELLERVREVALGAYAHQDVPFEMLVDELQPERDMSHSPLFQVMLVLQNAPRQVQELSADLTLSPVEMDDRIARFDLVLTMLEDQDGLSGSLEYNTDLFEASTIQRWVAHFQKLLEGIVSNPDQSITDLPLLTDAERHQLLVDWNDTADEFPRDLCVHQLFEEQVARTPDALAVSFEGQHLTYAELNQRANQLAHHLRRLGISPGNGSSSQSLVGICVERSLEMVVGLLGILKAGGAYLPLDPAYPEDRLAFMLEDARVPVLLTQEHLSFTTTHCPLPATHFLCLDRDWPAIAQEPAENVESGVAPDDLAYVIYTSGSTGKPKGVMLRHEGLCNLVHAQTRGFGVTAQSRVLQFASFSFDASVSEIFMALLTGATLYLAWQDTLTSIPDLLRLLRSEKITAVTLPPSFLKLLPSEELPDLEILISAGESCSKEIAERWAPGRRFFNAYGPTEATIGPTFYRVREIPEMATTVPIGYPIDNTQIYLLDAHRHLVPAGVPGEIYIGGVGVARGYLNRPELTAEKFVPNPFKNAEYDSSFSIHPSEFLYRTGDLGRYLPDGSIEFLGRVDHQVKLRGFRIELGEIEALLSQHPSVRQAAALVRQDTPGDPRLVAYVVAGEGQSPTASQLRSHLHEGLPEYMLPSAIVFLDKLPLTPNGKVDREVLPAPELSRDEMGVRFVQPRTPTEEIVAGIWSQVLGMEQVGALDNFFDLGGHSLLATQVISRVREAFQVELPLRTLFETTDLAGLAEGIEDARREAQGSIAPAIQLLPRDGITGVPFDPPPLSFAQQRLWFLEQLEPGTAFYNLPAAVRLSGPLNVQALEKCLNEIVRRHESLRTTFPATTDGRAIQVVLPELYVTLPVEDLSDLSQEAQEAKVTELASEEALQPFNLAEAPLLRVRLLKLTPEDHIVLLNMHHIVSDGWSMGVFIREVAVLYEAYSADRESPLADLAIQYTDFAAWQREWLRGEVLESQLAYWKEQLAGLPPLLELPTDRPRSPVQTFRGATQTFALPKALSGELKELCRETGTTLFIMLLAAFQTLLYRYTGQEDISVGTPIANRNRAEIEDLIGFFVNTLVLRANISGELTFRDLLRRVRESALGAYAHQDVPFEMLVDELQPERDMSHSPLFQVVFTLQNTPVQAQKLSELTLSPVEADSGIAKFDLTLSMTEGGDHLSGSFEYNTDLFDAETIERMIGHLQVLLEGILEQPDQPISELPLLTPEEQQVLLFDWNDTTADYPRERCAQELFEAQVARTPQAVAVNFEGEILTYAELNRRANQLAHYLCKQGVGPEVIVGICVERSLEMIIGLLGIMKAGGAYLPLDPVYPEERLAFMLEDAQVSLLLTQENLLEKVSGSGDRLSGEGKPHLTHILPLGTPHIICLDRDWSKIAQESTENPLTEVALENLAYVIYTSGSTGRPKGVLLVHRGLCNLATTYIQDFGIKPGSNVLQFFSFGFDGSVADIFSALLSGATLCLPRRDTVVSMIDLHRFMLEYKVSHVLMTPSALAVLPDDGLVDLKTVLAGGEACTQEVYDRWSPGRNFVNAYGPTEATVASTWHQVENRPPKTGSISIGKPIANAHLYVLDKYLHLVPIGVPGELHIGGAGLARGYLNRPELTAEKFIDFKFKSSNFEIEDRVYKTGDLVRYLPNGDLEFLGRIDHQVKVRGFRIELGEIEAVLSQHPNLQNVVVLAREDTPGHKRLVAYVLPEEEPAPTLNELREFMQGNLPDYMIPAVFVTLKSMPLTASGKIDRRALPVPEVIRPEDEEDFVAARTPIEEILAKIWAQMLGLQKVSVHENFFEIGGDSIMAIQMIARAGQAGIHITPKQLFQFPTIEGLVKVVGDTGSRRAEQGIVTGSAPLTPIQHWFFEHNPVEPNHWNTSMMLEIDPGFDIEMFKETLRQLMTHHDALRLRFPEGKEGRLQINDGPRDDLPFIYYDFSSLLPDKQRENLETQAAHLQADLDLDHGPLLRMAYFDMGAERSHRLLFIFHHLVMDGVSWRIFIEDFQTIYQQLSQGEPAKLPPKTTAFIHWAQQLREYAQSTELRQELDGWLEIGKKEIPHFPADYPVGANTFGSANHITVSLTPSETKALLQEVPAAYGVQINEILLTALIKALSRRTGKRTCLFEMEGHGREDILEGVDLSRTIGWFTTTFPVLLDFESAQGLGEEVRVVSEQLRRIPNQGIGYGLLRDLCDDEGVRSQLRALPSPEVNFNYLGQFDHLPSSEWIPFRVASESVGPEQNPEETRNALMYVVGIVSGGALHLRWLYSKELHKPGTVKSMANDYVKELRSVIATVAPDSLAGAFEKIKMMISRRIGERRG